MKKEESATIQPRVSLFIGVTMPLELVTKVKPYLELLKPYSSFRTPLHITLLPPFLIAETEVKELITVLKSIFADSKQGTITLDSIAYFKGNKSVVFLKPDNDSFSYLHNLHIKATAALDDSEKESTPNSIQNKAKYRPHLTIGKRIPRNAVPDVIGKFENFKDVFSFNVSSVDIYKQEKDSSWVKYAEIGLGK
jgi:2'-5' RNA ligase